MQTFKIKLKLKPKFKTMSVLVVKLNSEAAVPCTNFSRYPGVDIMSDNDFAVLSNGNSVSITTGLGIMIPRNCVGQLTLAPELHSSGFHMFNGIIPGGNACEIRVNVLYRAQSPIAPNNAFIKKGTHIATLVVKQPVSLRIQEVARFPTSDELEDTELGRMLNNVCNIQEFCNRRDQV